MLSLMMTTLTWSTFSLSQPIWCMVALSRTSPSILLACWRADCMRRSSVEWRALYHPVMSASDGHFIMRLCRRSGECSSKLYCSVMVNMWEELFTHWLGTWWLLYIFIYKLTSLLSHLRKGLDKLGLNYLSLFKLFIKINKHFDVYNQATLFS